MGERKNISYKGVKFVSAKEENEKNERKMSLKLETSGDATRNADGITPLGNSIAKNLNPAKNKRVLPSESEKHSVAGGTKIMANLDKSPKPKR